MVVQHNMSALFTNIQVGAANKSLAKTTEKLNSGYKVNRAADDAAGLSISEKMRWQIRGLNRSANNVQDGISYVQVADGALEESQRMLQRINELCVQAANDTNTESDRAAINEEVQALKKELDRTFNQTEFNTMSIWYIDENDRKNLTGTKQNTLTSIDTGSYSITDETSHKLSMDGTYAFTATKDYITASWTGLDGVAYTSTTSMEDFKYSGIIDFSSASPGGNGPDLAYVFDINAESSDEDIMRAFNGKIIQTNTNVSLETVFTPYVDGLYTGEMKLNYGKIYESYMSNSNRKMDFDNTSADDVAKAFYPTGSRSNLTDAGPSANPEWTFSFNMNGVGAIKAKASSISYSASSAFGSSRTSNLNSLSDVVKSTLLKMQDDPSTLPSSAGSISINFDMETSSGEKIGSYQLKVQIENYNSATSIDDLTNNVVNKIQSSLTNTTKLIPGAMNDTVKLPDPYNLQSETTVYDDNISLEIQAGTLENQNITLKYKSLNANKLGIRLLNTNSQANASYGISKVATALDIVSEQRSLFGAYQNRFEHAYANNTNTSENVQAAESRIRDTDYAAEMVRYSASNIVSQAASSMLTQANSNMQGILDLLT